MSQMDVFVAVLGDDERRLIKDVISESAESILLLVCVGDGGVRKTLRKAMLYFSAQSIDPNRDVCKAFHTASTLSSRLRTPLTAASPYAQRALYHTSLLLFAFQEQSFTVVVCRTVEYTTETFLRLTDGAAAVLGCHIPSVRLYIEETTCNSIDLGLLAAEARASKENLSCCCVDHKEHVSCGARFQDKLAYDIHGNCTSIMGEAANALLLGFRVMPPLADGDALYRSVYPSPRTVGYADLGLRFAEGGTELPRASGSRILDWDLCYKELQQENARAVGRGTLAALERDNSDLCLRCDYLEARLQHTCGDFATAKLP
ncbi:hypothetical protein CGC21_23005 [Leishmania donovani]|uniref:Uncharacterized protein n=1 Tax=Leishmania donovani TaxID=5661 RepID=A0A504XZ61_LEIDO|nr:hypothetical protein CGC21_23005 [Leishmania donovani]